LTLRAPRSTLSAFLPVGTTMSENVIR